MANYKDDLQGPSPGGSGSTASPQLGVIDPRNEQFWREIFVTALPILLKSDALTFGGAAPSAATVADQALAEFTRRWPSNTEGSQGGK